MSSQLSGRTSVEVHAEAASGLLARLAVVLNPHPVSGFEFAESPDGSVTVIVRLDAGTDWHLKRVIARLNRVVGVTSVEPRHSPQLASENRRYRPPSPGENK